MSHVTSDSVFSALRKGATVEPVDAATEAQLIVSAQQGDDTATYRLISLYAPAARNALARFSETLDREDAEQEVLAAFLDLIRTHDADKSPRLAGRVASAFRRDLAEAANAQAGGWSIPSRTLDRFYGILRRADGDVSTGAELSPQFEMPSDTFLAIATALRMTDSVERLAEASEAGSAPSADRGIPVGGAPSDAYLALEDRIMVRLAFAALDERETPIMRFAYGFDVVEIEEEVFAPEGAAPLADSLVAVACGLSRPTVQRARTAALGKMRAALALDEEVSA